MKKYDFLIVGSGFAGSVSARELAELGYKVLIIDKRDHIGGNAYDYYDKFGNLVHKYGPHIFHTNSKKIFTYLSRFTEWRYYSHMVKVSDKNQLYPFPINRLTLNQFFKINLKESEVNDFIQSKLIKLNKIKNSEDYLFSVIGKELTDVFFRGYTKKQWSLDLSELDKSVAARIPFRSSDDSRYFSDRYQYMPKNGYSQLFSNLLNHQNIKIELGFNFDEKVKSIAKKIIYTGPVDSYFNYKYGKLPYRSLEFKHKNMDHSNFQSVGTINFPNQETYTRITEFSHLTGITTKKTAIVKEYPTSKGDPYYPIPNETNKLLYQKYYELCKSEDNTFFIGRLAQYKYYNMDQVIASALSFINREFKVVGK